MNAPTTITKGLLAILLLASVTPAQSPNRPGPRNAFVIRRTEKIIAERPPGVVHPRQPIFELRPNGAPAISPAGYVKLRTVGDRWYTGVHLRERAGLGRPRLPCHSPEMSVPELLWGEIEAIHRLDRLASSYHARTGRRLGIGDISSPLGGYPDYSRDGVSDHLTHQAGLNVNILMPTSRTPEVLVHLGRRNDDAYSHADARVLLELMRANGARSTTTNDAARLLPSSVAAAGEGDGWEIQKKDDQAPVIVWLHRPSGFKLIYITRKGGHGSHLNTLFRPVP